MKKRLENTDLSHVHRLLISLNQDYAPLLIDENSAFKIFSKVVG